MLGAVLRVCVEVFSQDGVTAGFLPESLQGIIPFWSIHAHFCLLICRILQISSADSFSPFFALFVMAHPLPQSYLPRGLVVGGGGEALDEVGFADQPFSSVVICDELTLAYRHVDGVLANVDQP